MNAVVAETVIERADRAGPPRLATVSNGLKPGKQYVESSVTSTVRRHPRCWVGAWRGEVEEALLASLGFLTVPIRAATIYGGLPAHPLFVHVPVVLIPATIVAAVVLVGGPPLALLSVGPLLRGGGLRLLGPEVDGLALVADAELEREPGAERGLRGDLPADRFVVGELLAVSL